ncbi:MAG: metallophosphoesterase [Chitinophagaceae bacterium]
MKKFTFIFFSLLLTAFAVANLSFNTIQKAADALLFDGPYVLYRNDQVFIKYVYDEGGVKSIKTDSIPMAQKGSLSLMVGTDVPGKTFSVQLKKELENEKTGTDKASKQFIVSDIEGNFRAFRKLLQGNGVIDENFNWTFGEGHLVLIGDFFDRGDQVTEVLWLIYSLEDKAKAAGGHVHFVLGNHEIMNLNGDIRYVHPKYFEGARLVNENYMTLYGDQSELGRWLRTKNIMEKVGDILFIHGGISAEVNRMDLSPDKVNQLARPYYADSTYKFPDPRIDTLYSEFGPFWFRGYYTGQQRTGLPQVDSTLSLYGVKHIATGHTVISDTISVLFNGKVFNTDVHHVKGHSEALLLEDGKFYRVNALAEKFLVLE